MLYEKFRTCNDSAEPFRGIAALTVQGMFQQMMTENDYTSLEVSCLTVQFPTLSKTSSAPILGRALRECRVILDCGINMNFYMFHLPKEDSKDKSGRFRVILFVQGGSPCTAQKLQEDLQFKLTRLLAERPVFVTLNSPPQSEYQGAMTYPEKQFPVFQAWLGHYLFDAEALNFGHKRVRHPRQQQIYAVPRWKYRATC